jgi:putative nucleotidyltransferase with HDIG domain
MPIQSVPQDTSEDLYAFLESFSAELSSGAVQLPSFPDALMRIRDVLADSAAPTGRVVKAMQMEPVFTARLVKMANSVLYARHDPPVSDIGIAVQRLGYELVRDLAVAEATRQLVHARTNGFLRPHLKRLWEHSILTAALATTLAQRFEGTNPDQAMVAGLVHDIGKAYLLGRFADRYAARGPTLLCSEFVADWHASVGRSILETWDLPEIIIASTEEHENLDRDSATPGTVDLVDFVIVANVLANRTPAPPHGADDPIGRAASRLLMTEIELWALVQSAASDIRTVVESLR